MRTVNLEINKNLTVEVTGEYTPAEGMVMYDKNGEGHPGSGAEFYITDIKFVKGGLLDIMDHVDNNQEFYNYLVDKCIDQIQKEDNG